MDTNETLDQLERDAGDDMGTLALEVAYLRGALQAREQECQQMMADRMMMHEQQEALMRSVAELTVKIATMSATLTELLVDAQTNMLLDFRNKELH